MAKKLDKKKEEVKPEPVSATEIVDFEKIKSTTSTEIPVVVEQAPPRAESLGEKNKRERLERKGK